MRIWGVCFKRTDRFISAEHVDLLGLIFYSMDGFGRELDRFVVVGRFVSKGYICFNREGTFAEFSNYFQTIGLFYGTWIDLFH